MLRQPTVELEFRDLREGKLDKPPSLSELPTVPQPNSFFWHEGALYASDDNGKLYTITITEVT